MSNCVYCDSKILKEMQDGHIVIDPFNEKNLNNCSYNVTLSEYFFREKQASKNRVFNPWSESHVKHHWIKGVVEVATKETSNELGLKEGEKFIRLAPFETILIATQEFIGGRDHITTMVKGRSSCGRALLSVCSGAGWGDVGYINRWTLMVTSFSRFSDLIIPVGSSIAQIVFLEAGQPRSYYQGKYQDSHDLEKIKKDWSPRMMLPQLYKDHPESDDETPEDDDKAGLMTSQYKI